MGCRAGTLFIYFVISLTTYFILPRDVLLLGILSSRAGYVTAANNFLPAGPRKGCRVGIEPGTAVQQPSALSNKLRCTL
jgi:hypothetical protein